MKKIFMFLLVFVCSIVLCVSVFAVEAQACEDGCEAEAVQQEEVAETANTRALCSHNNYYEYGTTITHGYGGPSMCMNYYWNVVKCRTCDAVWMNNIYKTTYNDHTWHSHQHVQDDGDSVYCQYCSVCGYHSREQIHNDNNENE